MVGEDCVGLAIVGRIGFVRFFFFGSGEAWSVVGDVKNFQIWWMRDLGRSNQCPRGGNLNGFSGEEYLSNVCTC